MIVFQLFMRLFGYHISVVVKRQPDKRNGVADDPGVASFLSYLDEVENETNPADKYTTGRNGYRRSKRR